MVREFIAELEKLLDSEPMCRVDISPLIERSLADLNPERESSMRMKLLGILRKMEENGDVELDRSINFSMNARTVDGPLLQGPIYVGGTCKFDNRARYSAEIHVTGDHNLVITGNHNAVTLRPPDDSKPTA